MFNTDQADAFKQEILRKRRIRERLIRVSKAPINGDTFKYSESQVKRFSRERSILEVLTSLITIYYRGEVIT